MSRMTRLDYMAAHPQRQHIPTKAEQRQKFFHAYRRHLISTGQVPDPAKAPPKYKFYWCSTDHLRDGVVDANTRSEARAQVKVILGGSLPKSLILDKVGVRALTPRSSDSTQHSPDAG